MSSEGKETLQSTREIISLEMPVGEEGVSNLDEFI